MMQKRSKMRISCILLTLCLSACFLPACGKKQTAAGNEPSAQTVSDLQTDTTNPSDSSSATQNTLPQSVPELSRIRQICELVTVECTYHNVAKSQKAPGVGLEHIGESERTFWIEYTGIAEISYDINKIQMEQQDAEIIITLPRPKVNCKVDPDSWNANSYVISQDQGFQRNPITAEDQTKAINLAQAEMILQIRSNSSLLNTARLQAQELIKNYIDQIGEFTGVQYHITWKDAESGS